MCPEFLRLDESGTWIRTVSEMHVPSPCNIGCVEFNCHLSAELFLCLFLADSA